MLIQIYEIQDCIRYVGTPFVNTNTVVDWSLPSQFKLIFVLNSDSFNSASGGTNGVIIRFNNSTGVWFGKGASKSRDVSINGAVVNQIPVSIDTEYTIEYDNGNIVLSCGEDSVTTSATLTKLYSILAQNNNHATVKSVKLKPL